MADNESGQELETAVGAGEPVGSALGTSSASAAGASVAAAAGTASGTSTASGVGASPEVTLDPLSADVGESAEATETMDAEHVPAPTPPMPPGGWFQGRDEAAIRVIRATHDQRRRFAAANNFGVVDVPLPLKATIVSPPAGQLEVSSQPPTVELSAHSTAEASTTSPEPQIIEPATFEDKDIFFPPKVELSAAAKRTADIRDVARALSREFAAQVNDLKRSKPNEPVALAKYDDLVALFEKMAAGLAELADALDKAISEATDGRPEPVFLGLAGKIVEQLQLGLMEWLGEYRTSVIDIPMRVGLLVAGVTFLHKFGADSVAAVSGLTALVFKRTPRGEKSAKRKSPEKLPTRKKVGPRRGQRR